MTPDQLARATAALDTLTSGGNATARPGSPGRGISTNWKACTLRWRHQTLLPRWRQSGLPPAHMCRPSGKPDRKLTPNPGKTGLGRAKIPAGKGQTGA